MTDLRQKMIRAMQLKNLSDNTQRAYLAAVTGLAKHYQQSPVKITKEMIEDYLLYLKNEKGNAPNSCVSTLTGLRFFYNRVTQQQIPIEYSLSRKVRKLPTVLPQDDICNIINAAENLKHRLMLMTTYSAGLRASEVIALKPKNIENKKMLIKVQDGKGGKDRYTLLSKRLLNELRDYYKTYRPKIYLFPSSYKHKNTLFTKKWGVSVRDSVKRSDHVLEYLARYTHRVAIANSRIKTLKNGRVSFTAKDRKKNRTASITISAVQFIRRFLLHSLPKGFVRIRHYGFLANRNRMVNLKTIRRLLKLPCQLTKMQASLKDMMLQLTGTDITRCPCCNKGKMQLLEKIPMYRARAPNYLAAVVG